MSAYDYDLFTIGAGSGGVRASRMAAMAGARVGIAEEYRVGGTCVIRGCVPKKLLVYAAEFGHAFHEAKGYGWTAQNVSFDWTKLIENKDEEIDRLNGIYIRNLKNAGVDIFETRAVVKGPHTVHLVKEGRDVTAERILIAAGGAPWVDESVPGHELAITSNEAFHLERLPKHVIIAGGGYIAVEFACIFRGLGAEVCLVYRGEDILRYFDRDISVQVHEELKRLGVRVVTQAVFEKIEKLSGDEKRAYLSNGHHIDADLIFWAVGRRPNTAGLGLEEAGVALGRNGAVKVDEWSRSSVPSIFAIGDVTDRVNLTPVAIREGAAFAETEFMGRPTKMDYDFIPKAVFSTPPVGSVGYPEHEARKRFASVDIYKTDFRPMKNTLSGAEHRTLMKLVVDGESDRVVGVHIVGEGAPEMIQCLAIAVKAGVTKRQFDETCALHPTSAEELVLMREKFVPEMKIAP
ncbi:glutathione-disulfide reductase [Amphiplicatus metriothermophilus]|uniref:Glutathione reductase n=1 Tax=Amphiplicatus metriothermophilus TaxID=1519374 RepID=A0A239PSS9_9PROT|nr:glutathione-disulfide reductase [Amphiplicatus metriothermophilus]MBB5519128.1 glutathione reductase (NADPH) [Amphiplicatus metriothermophilus]SNT73198.1 NADPH-glutathione reductase [Amphiplicatus metriothermophilus]